MAASLKKRFGIDSTLIRLSGGIFEISLGDELLFSKKELGRFPRPGEVETLVQGRRGPGGAP